jgi:hypothetical protein
MRRRSEEKYSGQKNIILTYNSIVMFSSRLKWNLESNRLSRLIAQKQEAGAHILDLTESNPTRAGLSYPEAEVLRALGNPASLLYEPSARGLRQTREAVSVYYRERGFAVDPERIHLTASTSEAYSYLFKLLTDHGDSVLIAQPSYPLFEFLAAMDGVKLRPYELQYLHPRGWQIDFESIENAIDKTTRAILLVSPNNPTGSFLKREELARLNKICAQHDIALIADEVFGDYGFDEDPARVRSIVDDTEVLSFTLSGISKILALPQMKLGWIVSSGPAAIREQAISRLDFIADTFLSVSAPVQHAAADWLQMRGPLQEQIRTRCRKNLEFLRSRTEGTACRLLSVEGGWYATIEIPRHMPEEEWVLSLLDRVNVLAHPGYFFDFRKEAYLILSLLPEEKVFDEAVKRISKRMD